MKLIRQIVLCAGLIALAATSAFSQITPTSGALLTITGNAGSTPVNINIYDSQIHSGLVQVVPTGLAGPPTCTSLDQVPTDAYVLQGGSPTGCDAGDAFEVTEILQNSNPGHQLPGMADVSGFHIETHYICAAGCFGNGVFPPKCNTSGTICALFDTGFLTITNNTGSNFTGTITLQGNSPITAAQTDFCPMNGAANDTWSLGLTTSGPGQAVTLALGSQGPDSGHPKNSDSSNCGGFNQGQTQTLMPGQTSTFTFGMDDYQTTPLDSNPGETLTITPIPVPSGFAEAGTVTFSPLTFDPGPNFPGKKCVAYKDFSAPGNPVCVEIQRACGGPCSPYLYTAQLDFNIDGSSLPNGVGGVTFMGKHFDHCPENAFDLNIFFSYTGAVIDPVKGSGSGGGGSCFVAAFDPTAAPIPTGNTFSSFVGFQSPVSDSDLNIIKAGSAVPLIWQQFSSPGVPITNLSWCPGPGVPNSAVCPSNPALPTPWVFLGTIQTNCAVDDSPNIEPDVPAGGSGLQNFGNGTYQFNWKTVKGSTGCVDVVLIYDTALTLYPAQFKYH